MEKTEARQLQAAQEQTPASPTTKAEAAAL
jgi:hypothetical protein